MKFKSYFTLLIITACHQLAVADNLAVPSTAELKAYPALPDGLLPISDEDSPGDRKALKAALVAFEAGNDILALEDYAHSHQNSVWTPSLLINIAAVNFSEGRFSRAMAEWKQAFDLANTVEGKDAKRLADIAIAKYAMMLSRLGRKKELSPLLAKLDRRTMSDVCSTELAGARDGLWFMQNKPQLSYRCGPVALGSILVAQKKPLPANFIEDTPSSDAGYSLEQVSDLAKKLGMDYEAAKREPGSEVIVPSVVHWTLGHYGAILQKQGDRYLMVDPTFQTQHWITAATLDEESSGYFLVPKGKLPSGWSVVSGNEAQGIHGKGVVNSTDTSQTKKCNSKVPGSCGSSTPMARYQMFLLDASLTVGDTPISYVPAFGPKVQLHVNYNQSEADQPSGSINYTNFGSKWECSWVSYLTDGGDGNSVTIQLPEGGSDTFGNFNSSTNFYDGRDLQSTATLQRTGSSASSYSYTWTMPDGSALKFGQIVGGTTSTRRIFLTQIIDPQGNAIKFQYDGTYPSRINRVYDATVTLGASSNYTELLYQDGDAYRVTKITDRFTRSAYFSYITPADGSRRLETITDPVGIVSKFGYDSAGKMSSLTTPYGRTRFNYSPTITGSISRWMEAVDPYGATERVEFNPYTSTGIPYSAPSNQVPSQGSNYFQNTDLGENNSFYWDKKAWIVGAGDYTKAHIYHWLRKYSTTTQASGLLESEKAPLESRIWYYYPGSIDQTRTQAHLGTSPLPSIVAKNVETSTTGFVTQTWQYEYNNLSNPTKIVDPSGRETTIEYDTNGVDIRYVKRKNGGVYDTLAEYQYNLSFPAHRPQYYYDAAGKKTEYTYTTQGLVSSVKNALNETTSFTYEPTTTAADYGKLKIITRPNTAETTQFTYDAAQRILTVTSSDTYVLTYSYDDIDRVTKILYPDTTFEKFDYDRLDLGTYRDRSKHPTIYKYNALRQLTTQIDSLGHLTQYNWCKCGSLESMTDANKHTTEWKRDGQSRVYQKIYADMKSETYSYEPLSGRLSTVLDGNSQTKTYHYNVDDTLATVDYTDGKTPKLTFSYGDAAYKRVTSIATGVGGSSLTTAFSYYPVAQAGALKLKTEDGPISNQSDIVTYTYDDIGRLSSQNVGTAAGTENKMAWFFDNLGRLDHYTTNLGQFSFPLYDGTTSRVKKIAYPNGQATTFQYLGNSGDHRLSQIVNLSDGTNPSSVLSQFDYLLYSPDGELKSLQRQLGSAPSDQYSFAYDAINELKSATRKVVSTGSVDKTFSYGYDDAWNRTSEQRDSTLTNAQYNSVNQLATQSGGGKFLVAGHTDEAAKVTVQGKDVPVSSDNTFSTQIDGNVGTTTISVTATDYSPNANTKTKQWAVSSSAGNARSFNYDNNGNMLSDGTKSYGWDQENRLIKVTVGSNVYEFTYDGLGRRITEKLNGAANRMWVWAGSKTQEERDSTGTVVTKRFYPLGEQWNSGGNAGSYFYTKDHLGSIREVINANGQMQTRYDYEPWGKRSQTDGDPPPVSGNLAMRSDLAAQDHQHFFREATTPMSIGTGDKLVAWVYLDPKNPPREVMLQWEENWSWEHRAYWGENLINYGSCFSMGALPKIGGWVRLEVPASSVGLEGKQLTGMAFTLYDGRAWWDAAGKLVNGASSDTLWVDDSGPSAEYVGNWTWVSSSPQASFSFSGYYYHQPSDLSLTLYRAYDASLARWLSRDPLSNAELEEGPNLYQYVRNDPANSWDPYGLFQSSFLLSWVPGQQSFDNGMTNIECGNYGMAAANFSAMLAEQILTAATFGMGSSISQAERAGASTGVSMVSRQSLTAERSALLAALAEDQAQLVNGIRQANRIRQSGGCPNPFGLGKEIDEILPQRIHAKEERIREIDSLLGG